MKITCEAAQLAGALSMVDRAVAVRSSATPILSAVLIEAKDGAVTVSATDNEIATSLRFKPQGGVAEVGRAAVPTRVLSDLAKFLPDGPVTLSIPEPGGDATLSARGKGAAEYKLRSYGADDYPKLPGFPEGEDESFSLPAGQLAAAIKSVLPSASKDETRPVLTGALAVFSGGYATLVTTDSYRLGLHQTEKLPGAPEEKKTAIIPARALSEVARIADANGLEEIGVALTENTALFKAPGLLISTRLIEGNFPEYDKLLPKSSDHEFAVNAAALAASLKRVNLFAGSQNPPAPVRLKFAAGEGSLTGGTLTASVESAETGGAQETIEADADAELEAVYNGNYLLDGVRAASKDGAEKVLFSLNEPMKPALIRPAPEKKGPKVDEQAEGEPKEKDTANGQGRFLYLIMPMRDPKG